MPTKTVVERKKAAPPKTKKTPTQAEIQASKDRLHADIRESRSGGYVPLSEIEKKLGL
ncbi:MAG: hypothetical protein GX837_05415 [Methanomicrobiales archaeon]|jgi:hypothetical protein|nr:hypothetical protein [Methanomicrobiales archaeon]